jgi:hypothetical protein
MRIFNGVKTKEFTIKPDLKLSNFTACFLEDKSKSAENKKVRRKFRKG